MPAKTKASHAPTSDFESLVTSILDIHRQANEFAFKAVNIGLTLRNWLIGHRIVEFEQQGRDRADYGANLLQTLAQRFAGAGLTRVDVRELRRFRLLYTVYPQIRDTVSPELISSAGMASLMPFLKLASLEKRETASPESSQRVESLSPQITVSPTDLLQRLSFSHLAELLELPDATQRRFYEIECIRGPRLLPPRAQMPRARRTENPGLQPRKPRPAQHLRGLLQKARNDRRRPTARRHPPLQPQERSSRRVCPRRSCQQPLRLPLRRGNAGQSRHGAIPPTTCNGDRP